MDFMANTQLKGRLKAVSDGLYLLVVLQKNQRSLLSRFKIFSSNSNTNNTRFGVMV